MRRIDIAPGLSIAERAEWAGGLEPVGELESESPGDVRFLLVHHTASRNTYSAAEVADELRGFFRYHTSAEKGWPDLAYNFMIDRFGGVWEGRAGSLTSPVMGSATGGSQGFAQLACYIGDFSTAAPTAEARAAMIALLAWLADRYDIDTTDGATATFVSRGSNRWPEGTTVTTPTISGHRDMSQTECPGDPVYADLRARYPADVSARRAASHSPAPASPSPSQTADPVVPTTTPTPPADTSSPPVTSQPTKAPSIESTQPQPPSQDSPSGATTADGGIDEDDWWPVGIAAAGALAAGAGATYMWRRGGEHG